MGGLGVLFALDQQQTDALRAVSRHEIPDYIANELEEVFFDRRRNDLAELDKSWDAMHRAFSGGKLHYGGVQPLCGVILDGEVLYGNRIDEQDYIAVLNIQTR